MKKAVIGSYNSECVLIEKGEGNVETFVGFVQLISDKKATTLKSTALLSYRVHAILVNFFVGRIKWLI